MNFQLFVVAHQKFEVRWKRAIHIYACSIDSQGTHCLKNFTTKNAVFSAFGRIHLTDNNRHDIMHGIELAVHAAIQRPNHLEQVADWVVLTTDQLEALRA